MKKPLSAAISNVLVASSVLASPLASANETSPTLMEEMTITAIREDRKSRGATGLDLGIYETPQSLTIIDAKTIDEFVMTDINALLALTTGVNVDKTETDRTYYNARGFDITSMHMDGIGMPFGELLVGDIDTAIYDKVEVIRGSNGLITGLGNPSGTINYVRKRPTNEFAGSVKVTGGKWNNHRADVDVSVPLTESGSWAARAVVAYQDKESWLDHYANERKVGYFVVDGQLTDNITLALGHTHQNNQSDGVLWGALPAIYTNGAQAAFEVSTTTTMDWTYWNTKSDETFTELSWQINDRWHLTTSAMYTEYEERSEVFYIYSNTGLDQSTGLGLESYPGKFDEDSDELILDFTLNGTFDAWGREHQLQLGYSAANRDSVSLDYGALTGFTPMPEFPGWRGDEVTRPTWAAPYQAAAQDIELNRLYSSALFSLSDNVKLILGLSAVDYTNDGISWGVSTDSTEDGTSPYLGFTWEIFDGLNAYASYSDIYQPQYVLGEDLNALGSAEGKSYELGVKKQFANNALISLALFRTKQSNLQEFVEYGDGDGVDDTDYTDDFDFAIYRGINVESDGIELEVMGNLTNELSLQAGFTHLRLEDEKGNRARTFIPKNSLKMLLSWKPTELPKLQLGVSARQQSKTYYDSGYGRITQDNYLVLGGYVDYAATDNLSLALNLENLSDEKYFSSVKYDQVYYAAPRSFSISANWRF